MIRPRSLLLSGLSLALAATAAHATNNDLAIHGQVSASTAFADYSFAGAGAESLSVNQVEALLNGNHRFNSGLRFGAQLLAFKHGDYDHLGLDYASFDYSFNEAFGVRLGRNRTPIGLYGDTADIDSVRPFTELPLSFYAKMTRRTVLSNLDSLQFYGSCSVGTAGSVEYQVYGGWAPPADPENPLLRGFVESLYTSTAVESGPIYGARLGWNTVIEGLRLNVAYQHNGTLDLTGPMKTAAAVSVAPSDARALPAVLGAAGVSWDALIAGQTGLLHTNSYTQTYLGAEFARGDWVFAAEYKRTDFDYHLQLPLLGLLPAVTVGESYYGSISYQATPKLQFGAYYAEDFSNVDDRIGQANVIVPQHRAWQKDLALATAYNLAPWWIVKAEIHAMNGTGGLFGKDNPDATTWKENWGYYVLKTSVSF